MFTRSARYYDHIYAALGKDYAREANVLRRLVGEHLSSGGRRLLDVACGTGGHLEELKVEFDVEGLDLDESMLEIAAERVPGVPLHTADMVEFSLPVRFDVIACLFSSIGYAGTLDRMEQAVVNMAAHLRPGGLLIVEPWLHPEDFTAGFEFAVFVDQPDLKLARMNVSQVEGSLSILDFHYLVMEDGDVRHFTERHESGLFTHEEYLDAVRAAGLKPIHDKEGLSGRGLYMGLRTDSI